jgi:hypothetical protein
MSTPTVRVINVAGTDCCPCPDQTDCGCGDHPCGFICRYKSGFASLCGYDEFTDPSDPPVKYRIKITTGNFVVCTGLEANCEYTPVGGEDSWEAHPSNIPVGGSPPYINTKTGNFRLEYVSTNSAGNIDTYRIVECNGSFTHWEDPGPHQVTDPQTATIRILDSPSGPGIFFTGGLNDTVTFATGQQGIPYPIQGRVGDDAIIEETFTPMTSVNNGPGTSDEWNLQSTYSATDCSISQNDTSTRQETTASKGQVCVKQLGAEEALGCASPSSCYGPGIEVLSEGKTERVYQGVGCLEYPTTEWANYDGTVTEALSTPDTADNAVTRANVNQSWSNSPSCIALPAFISDESSSGTYTYRTVQTNATAYGLTIGLNYNVEIRFYRRQCCGVGPYTYQSSWVAQFTATATSEPTGWIDVPNVFGYETVPLNCSVSLA